ncbi:20S proteasome subunit beta 3 [Fonticula alba]|uniref:Proteasome subunit beta n=1 Tax=Fonticula alba TaxID=691883 RepID=A0A058Z2E5_FONAL|nr:20S proteasome subunit beta 3 [Fonticula alba]KCV68425.1 20S proteasome subunit beta 3 [Fonticula alba]|eukprot:XP_009496857.1 20S proteasome subunit beta 3 [Fonticula alba]
MSIMSYNGSAMLAMVGRDCVAIASDTQLSANGQMISTDFQRVHMVNNNVMIGMSGLATDVQTLWADFRARTKMYKLREERDISPRAFAHMVSSALYQRRFGPYFIEPVIAGIDPDTKKPYVCSTDIIGCIEKSPNFVVAGTCTENLYGMCETLFRPDMDADDLFETVAQALVNAFDRDAYSGQGAIVHILTPTELITRTIKTRTD